MFFAFQAFFQFKKIVIEYRTSNAITIDVEESKRAYKLRIIVLS